MSSFFSVPRIFWLRLFFKLIFFLGANQACNSCLSSPVAPFDMSTSFWASASLTTLRRRRRHASAAISWSKKIKVCQNEVDNFSCHFHGNHFSANWRSRVRIQRWRRLAPSSADITVTITQTDATAAAVVVVHLRGRRLSVDRRQRHRHRLQLGGRDAVDLPVHVLQGTALPELHIFPELCWRDEVRKVLLNRIDPKPRSELGPYGSTVQSVTSEFKHTHQNLPSLSSCFHSSHEYIRHQFKLSLSDHNSNKDRECFFQIMVEYFFLFES